MEDWGAWVLAMVVAAVVCALIVIEARIVFESLTR